MPISDCKLNEIMLKNTFPLLFFLINYHLYEILIAFVIQC